jgi:prophage regulatory protein
MLKTRAGDIIGTVPEDVRFLRRREVEHLTGLSRSSIYLLMKEGRFPKPVRLGPKCVAWVEREVRTFLLAKVAERDGKAHDGCAPT